MVLLMDVADRARRGRRCLRPCLSVYSSASGLPSSSARIARASARKADIDALDAEIQSLAVPENANAAMVPHISCS